MHNYILTHKVECWIKFKNGRAERLKVERGVSIGMSCSEGRGFTTWVDDGKYCNSARGCSKSSCRFNVAKPKEKERRR